LPSAGPAIRATGGNFILGQANTAATTTILSSSVAARTLSLQNPSAAAGASALGLVVAAGRPPFLVNSSVKVQKLNADLFDGLNSTAFARKTTLPFTIGAGAITNPIAVPVNQLVYLMGASTGAYIGVGQVTLFRLPGIGVMWMGLSQQGGVTSGFASATGTPITNLSADTDEPLIVEVVAPDGIRLNNQSLSQRTGVLKFLW
jgi:hypothetical protein